MRRLRILTGRHVGSSLDLDPGMHLIGANHGCDITVTDWTFVPLRLVVDEDGIVTAEWDASPADGATRADAGASPTSRHRFDDFVPRRFENVVLCVGPCEGDWPADVVLLDHIFQPTPERVAKWAGARLLRGRPAFAAGAGVLSLAAVGIAWAMFSGPSAPPPPTLAAARGAMQRSLDQLNAGKLDVKVDNSTLVVTGIVETSDQAGQARALIEASRGLHPALQRFAVASDVAEAIRGAVGLPGATVKHAGDGVFTYTADAPDLNAARHAVDRAQADLSSVVRRIDVTIEHTAPTDSTPILSRMTGDGLSVVQTRDGVKHLIVRSAADSPISTSELLSLPSPLSRPESLGAHPMSASKEKTP
jgi:type III secretion protein D